MEHIDIISIIGINSDYFLKNREKVFMNGSDEELNS